MRKRAVRSSDSDDRGTWKGLTNYWCTVRSDWSTGNHPTFPVAVFTIMALYTIITGWNTSLCADRDVRRTQTLVNIASARNTSTFRPNNITERPVQNTLFVPGRRTYRKLKSDIGRLDTSFRRTCTLFILLITLSIVTAQDTNSVYGSHRKLLTTTQTYATAGTTLCTVPPGVTYISATLVGASGGEGRYNSAVGAGGKGGWISAIIPVTPGETLQINVGGQGGIVGQAGANGGGTGGVYATGSSGGGGGASDIRRSPYALGNRLIVAGGGGGGYSYFNAPGGNGGYPSGETGSSGTAGSSRHPTTGGTATSGGTTTNPSTPHCYANGTFGMGASNCGPYGGGGGGGWYGGGNSRSTGGGGGSSYIAGGIFLTGHGVAPTASAGSVTFTVQQSDQPTSQPSGQPSRQPSGQPSRQPTRQPSGQPSRQPSSQPSTQPSRQPSGQPSRQPSRQPSAQPSATPTSQPSSQPTNQPSPQPSRQPSGQPSRQPTAQPTAQPSGQPSNKPSGQPSGQPSAQPSRQPIGQPSMHPTGQPSRRPSSQPSVKPSVQPSAHPTCHPSSQPSSVPSGCPTAQPSSVPTGRPTGRPSSLPSAQPSTQPTTQPSMQPSGQPSGQPSVQPSLQPSTQPSVQPSAQPTTKPSLQPSGQPSAQPSAQPSEQPSSQPSGHPTSQPSRQPSAQPTGEPSSQPSKQPSVQPSGQPSSQPSAQPSACPSAQPSAQPTLQPTVQPSMQPTSQPSSQPGGEPSAQPSSQPTSQPSSSPSAQPSTQPTVQPSKQPSSQPSRQPSQQPSSRPTAQPSAQPSSAPSLQPSGQPSAQPSRQPSRQPSGQPSAQPSHSPTRPTVIPTAQPSRPTAIPTFVPSKAPTIEWIASVERVTEMQEVSLVNNEVWSCGRGASNGSQSCTVMDGASGEVSAVYALPWDEIIGVVENGDRSGMVMVGQELFGLDHESEVAYCQVFRSQLNCEVVAVESVVYTATSCIPHTGQIVLTGTYNGNPVVSVADSRLITIQSYRYDSTSLTSMSIGSVYSVPAFLGTFVAGTCMSSIEHINIMFGWIRSYTGVMTTTTLTPTVGNIVLEGQSMTQAVAMDVTQLDMFIAGGVRLSDSAGTHAYVVRVNALYQSVLYGVRYRYGSGNARRTLTDTSSGTIASAVKSLALVDTILYLLVQVVDNSGLSSVSILKTNATNGVIVKQAHIGGSNSSITCTNIVQTTFALAIGCSIQYALTSVTSTVIALSSELTFSKLPVGFVRHTDVRFSAENVGFTAVPLAVSASAVFLRATQFGLNSTRDSYTRAYPPTAAPTGAPVITPTSLPSTPPSPLPSSLPSSAPSEQPSSSPSAAPSVSPQPSSQPSSSGPTITYKPTKLPTVSPTRWPSIGKTTRPTVTSTLVPTARPSLQPSLAPSARPSSNPTARRTTAPSTVRPTSPKPTVEDLQNLPEVGIAETKESHNEVTGYVIGCSVVGGLLLAALCAWIFYTKRQRKNNKENKTFFSVNPTELATLGDTDNDHNMQSPHATVPIVNMHSPKEQEQNRKVVTSSRRDANRLRCVSFASSASENSVENRVKSRNRNNSMWSSWSGVSGSNRVRTRSESCVYSLEEGSSMYSLPSDLSDLTDNPVFYENCNRFVRSGDEDRSNGRSLDSVSTDSSDSSHDSVNGV